MRLIFLFFIVFSTNILAQSILKIAVQDSLTNEILVGANISVKNSPVGAETDLNGICLLKIRNGKNELVVSYVGYKTQYVVITTDNYGSTKTIMVLLVPQNIEVGQVTVSSSRVNSYVNNSPQRIEFLGSEELQEKTFENPSNISEMLSELSAVNVIQTSNFSGTTNFRLFGLSGQYTQILKDGFPLFGGLSQDFGLVQIPPLDLAQIEIIKGASATFYGNGAVAGIVNLISREPEEKSKAEILINVTDYGGIDAGVFYSSKKSKTAFTLLAMTDFKQPKDVNGDGFTEISKQRKFNIEPKLFFNIDESSRLIIGVSFLHDEHSGGDLSAVNSSPSVLHPFIVKSNSNRINGTIDYQKYFGSENIINLKSGMSLFDLLIESPELFFKGKQTSSYTDFSFSHNTESNRFTAGISLVTDNFRRDSNSSIIFENAFQAQFGLFAVDNLKLSSELNLQLSLRLEDSNNFKSYFLPNVSLIYKPANDFSIRFGYGTGYRVPTQFSYLSEFETNENSSIKVSSPLEAEISNSFTFDCSYDLLIGGDFYARINQTLFTMGVDNPYQETTNPVNDEPFLFSQINSLHSYGTETNLRLGIEDANLFIGLTYQKTERKYARSTPLPLTPEFKLVTIFQIEAERLWELDLGNIYNGIQYLSNGEKVKPYTTFEALLKINVGSFTLVANCENIFNVMQSNTNPIVLPPYQNPRFAEIWGPIEGRTINFSLIYNY